MKNISELSLIHLKIQDHFLPFVNRFRLAIYVCVYMLSLSVTVQAQGLSGLQNLSPQDINALKNSVGANGLGLGVSSGGANFFSQGMTSPVLLANPSSVTEEEVPESNKTDVVRKKLPVQPNEFQKYVLAVTGKALPLYGEDFFENSRYAMQQQMSPVGNDYILGTGDQLLIRVWGSTSTELNTTINRNGEISIPRLGTIVLAGVKASEAQASIKALFNQNYKNIDVSVSLGKLRKITVFVVGQSRYPGSYQLNSQATLTSGLFASGGPNPNGSIRRVQLKRNGAVVTELDLYSFLQKGDKASDVRLQDGDVILYPHAAGHMAFVGKVNVPAVFEVKHSQETIADFINFAGGLSVLADTHHVIIDRITPAKELPRVIENLSLDESGLRKQIQKGDVITIGHIAPEMANVITLRGNVAQTIRLPFKSGMRISDVISHKTLLMSPNAVRKQNEVLFDAYEEERTARYRARVPLDLALERINESQEKSQEKSQNLISTNNNAPMQLVPLVKTEKLEKSPFIIQNKLVDKIGDLLDEVNYEYAVIERINRADLAVSIIPFNLGKVLADPKFVDNVVLQAGDVITVFSTNDIRIPISRRKAFVSIEGEVNSPGIYQVGAGDNLVNLIQKAGGITGDGYLFGASFYRDEVKKTQQENLSRLLRKIEMESSGSLSQASQSLGGFSDLGGIQAKISVLQESQKQSIERIKSLKPEGRISLGLPADALNQMEKLPSIRLHQGDKLYIPPRPDFVYILGSVNTESAIVYKSGLKVSDYILKAGSSRVTDIYGTILIRADGSALTNQSNWRNEIMSTVVLPGDIIVLPEKLDRESGWSVLLRNTKDFTQILYQLGLGAAAIKTLRQ
jgi:protein involved in polysaccharide export with SLBB domain